MSAILSDQFRFYNLDRFIDTLANQSIYMFIGRSYQWDDENYPPNPIDNQTYQYDVYDQIIALKRLYISNMIPVIKRIDWKSGVTYDMYRPDYTTGNTESSGSRYPSKLSSSGYSTLNYGANFYVMNEFYQVYKCLYNGQSPTNPSGVPSTIEPTGVSTSPIVTPDGYRWKYMYTIPTYYVINFINQYYIPVPYANTAFPPETAVTNSALNGSIDTVVITNPGNGYNNGTYVNIPIKGDGTGGNVSVVVSNGQISSATVTNSGSGYTFATIDLQSAGLGSGTNGQIEVVIPPKYGHGYSPYNEFGAYRLLIQTSLPYSEPFFPTDCSYRRVGLIANPYVKGTTTVSTNADVSQLNSITFTSTTGNFSVGEIITQSSTNASGRVVSWDSGTKTLKYYQDRFDGTYQYNLVPFSGTFAVTGSQSSVSGTPSTYGQPGIEKGTGRILYIDNRLSVNRAASQIEDIKIVVEF